MSALANRESVELYGGRFPQAISVFETSIGDALVYFNYPRLQHEQALRHLQGGKAEDESGRSLPQ
jgi:hypothetical protein